jgi:hypothetical protein
MLGAAITQTQEKPVSSNGVGCVSGSCGGTWPCLIPRPKADQFFGTWEEVVKAPVMTMSQYWGS